MRVFGPVPSRRLGKSIGINNIPPKHCPYACVYCQLGRALKMTVERQAFFSPRDLFHEVKEKIKSTLARGETIDYLTIVPDGEPTLDCNLGKLLRMLSDLQLKTAVITNATLLSLPDVREELLSADWVSVKIDSVDEKIWKKIDRPHKKLKCAEMFTGIRTFAQQFNGKLVTETMLVKDVNDGPAALAETGGCIGELAPDISYISIPTRPPAEVWAVPPAEETINQAYQIFTDAVGQVEYLIGYEGNAFPYSGNIEEDILSITAVHPMREDAVREYVHKAEGDFSVIDKLVADGKLIVSEYHRHRFYVRRFSRPLKGTM